jgi:hypothetical protein
MKLLNRSKLNLMNIQMIRRVKMSNRKIRAIQTVILKITIKMKAVMKLLRVVMRNQIHKIKMNMMMKVTTNLVKTQEKLISRKNLQKN